MWLAERGSQVARRKTLFVTIQEACDEQGQLISNAEQDRLGRKFWPKFAVRGAHDGGRGGAARLAAVWVGGASEALTQPLTHRAHAVFHTVRRNFASGKTRLAGEIEK